MIIYRGKKYKLVKAAGLRFGVGYTPHYINNKDIAPERARALIAWCGHYILTRTLPAPKNYEPRMPWDPERLAELDTARTDMTLEIDRAMRAKRRWARHVNMGLLYGMGKAKAEDMVHKDVRDRWQAESDAVKLREMEDAEREHQDPRD